MDNRTGEIVYSSRVYKLVESIGFYVDSNYNRKLDTGDFVVLRGNSIIEAGMKIQLLIGGNILDIINSLPELNGGARLELQVERTSNADWLITITGGSEPAAFVIIKVMDPSTRVPLMTTLIEPAHYNFVITPSVPNWGATVNTTCGIWNDNNSNNNIDTGDTILLYMFSATHTNGKDLIGMKVQFEKYDAIIGIIAELPI